MTKLKVFDLPIGDLVDYANNSKIHDEANVDAIRNSIERFGMCDPVGVWKNPAGEYEIVEGHGRKMALEQLCYDTVPCIDLSHLTDEERRAYSHVHNQTTLMTDLNLDGLVIEIAGLPEFDWTSFGLGQLDVNEDEFGDSFTLPDNDAPLYKTMTLTFTHEQFAIVEGILDSIERSSCRMQGGNVGADRVCEVVRQWAER